MKGTEVAQLSFRQGSWLAGPTVESIPVACRPESACNESDLMESFNFSWPPRSVRPVSPSDDSGVGSW